MTKEVYFVAGHAEQRQKRFTLRLSQLTLRLGKDIYRLAKAGKRNISRSF